MGRDDDDGGGWSYTSTKSSSGNRSSGSRMLKAGPLEERAFSESWVRVRVKGQG